jgi:hypothetical protein
MNFRHLPELEWAFGYPLVLVVMTHDRVRRHQEQLGALPSDALERL